MENVTKGVLAAAAAVALSAAFTSGAAIAQEKIKIGIVAHFSGPFAGAGKQFREGIEAYQEIKGNKAAGREIELIYRDVGGANPAAAKQAVQELIVRDKVTALGGFYLSPDAAAAVSVINETKTPAVIFNAAARTLTQQSQYFVRVGGTLYQTSTPAAEWAFKNNAKKAYIMVSDYVPGHDAQAAFKERFIKLGGAVIGEDRMALNTVDYAPFIERMANAKPDVVFFFLPNGTPATTLLRALAPRKLMDQGIKFIGLGVPDDQDLAGIGDAALGFYDTLYYAQLSPHAENKKFVETIRAKVGPDTTVTFNHAQAYDGMVVLTKMLESQAGKAFDGAAAIEAVKGFSWTGPQGPMKIDPETRNPIENIYIRRVEKVDGKLVNVIADTIPNVRDPGPGN